MLAELEERLDHKIESQDGNIVEHRTAMHKMRKVCLRALRKYFEKPKMTRKECIKKFQHGMNNILKDENVRNMGDEIKNKLESMEEAAAELIRNPEMTGLDMDRTQKLVS